MGPETPVRVQVPPRGLSPHLVFFKFVSFFFKVCVRTTKNYDPDPSQKIIGGGHPSFFEILDGFRENGEKLTFFANFLNFP